MEKETLKKLGKSLCLFAWLIGSIGGIFALNYHNEQPIAIALCAVIGLSVPQVKKWWRELL